MLMSLESSEEGARFPISMVSSGVWAGELPLQTVYDLRDIHDQRISVRSELERHGYLGGVACSSSPEGYPLGAHFEL